MADMQHTADACRRCLFREMSDSAYYKYVHDYLDSLLPENRVTKVCYEERLQQCRQCNYLLNGACRLCGCFVELRAASIHRHCPDSPPKW